MKEKIAKFIYSLRGPSYKELRREWEIQNVTIDGMTRTISNLEQKYKTVKAEKESLSEYYEEKIDEYEATFAALKVEIDTLQRDNSDMSTKLKKSQKKVEKLEAIVDGLAIEAGYEEKPKKRGRKKKEEVNNG